MNGLRKKAFTQGLAAIKRVRLLSDEDEPSQADTRAIEGLRTYLLEELTGKAVSTFTSRVAQADRERLRSAYKDSHYHAKSDGHLHEALRNLGKNKIKVKFVRGDTNGPEVDRLERFCDNVLKALSDDDDAESEDSTRGRSAEHFDSNVASV